jgi:hypothetical protein
MAEGLSQVVKCTCQWSSVQTTQKLICSNIITNVIPLRPGALQMFKSHEKKHSHEVINDFLIKEVQRSSSHLLA